MRSIPLLLIILVVGVNTDDYLNEIQNRCFATKKMHFCSKYHFFKYIDDYELGNLSLTSDSSVQFVNIPGVNVSVPLFEQSRQYSLQDSEFVKVMKYAKRRAVKFLMEQGFTWELPDEVQIVEEARKVTGKGKKMKKMIVLPLLILAKVFKIKILVSLVLVGIVAIKKMLLGAAFILPGVVAAIKSHCKSQQFHVVPYHTEEEQHHHTYEHEHDHDAGYGVSGYGGDKHYWDKKKRFSIF